MWINEKTLGIFTLHTDIRYECWKDGKELPAILDNAILSNLGYSVVTPVSTEHDPITQGLQARSPRKTDSGWVQEFDVIELDPAIIANNRNIVKVKAINALRERINWGNTQAMSALLLNQTEQVEAWRTELADLQAQLTTLEAQ